MKPQKPLSKPAQVDHAALKRASAAIRNVQIRWESASYQSAKSAAVADVRMPDGKLHRLYVKRTEPKARTFRGMIDGLTVGVWGSFDLAKVKLAELFLASGSSGRREQRRKEPRRETDRLSQLVMGQGATKLEELQALVKHLQDALGTGETGSDLVEVARNAAAAERELAALDTEVQGADGEDEALRALTRRIAGARGEES